MIFPPDRAWRLGGLAAVMLLHAGAVWALLPGALPMPAAGAAEAAPVLQAAIIDDAKPQAAAPPAPPTPVEQASPSEPPPPEPRPVTKPRPPPGPPRPAAQSAAAPAPALPPVAAMPTAAPSGAPASGLPAGGETVREPAPMSCRVPAYPPESRRAGESGTVLLRLRVDAGGAVIDKRVEHSSGFPRLDEAALEALAKCRFRPGEPAWARLRYVWKLQ